MAYLVFPMDDRPWWDLPLREATLRQASPFLDNVDYNALHWTCYELRKAARWGFEGYVFRMLPPRLPVTDEEWPRKKRAWHLLSRRR